MATRSVRCEFFVASGSTTNWIVWDGIHPVAEVDGSGNLKKSYLWGGVDRLLSLTVIDGISPNVYLPLTDYLGTVHALADSSGDIVESYRYDAHGRLLGVYDEDGQAIPESAVGNSVLWGGKFYSWKVHAVMGSGLYQNRARAYDPVVGRWLSKDPAGLSSGINEYLFCYNSPVMYADPDGAEPVVINISVDPRGKPRSFMAADVQKMLQQQLSEKIFHGLKEGEGVVVKITETDTPPDKRGWSGRNSHTFRVEWSPESKKFLLAYRSVKDSSVLILKGSVDMWAAALDLDPCTQTWVNILAHEVIWGLAGGFKDNTSAATGEIGQLKSTLVTPFTVGTKSREKLLKAFGL